MNLQFYYDRRISSAEFSKEVDRIAFILLNTYKILPGFVVSFVEFTECTPELVVLMFSVWKIGAVYFPTTLERFKESRVNAYCLIFPSSVKLEDFKGDNFNVYQRSFSIVAISSHCSEFKQLKDISYIVCTSGTTNPEQPTVVQVPGNVLQQNIRSIYNAADLTGIQRFLVLSPPSFDPSIADIVLAYRNSGTLHFYPKAQLKDTQRFVDYIKQFQIQYIFITPSLLISFTESQRYQILNTLKKLLVGGECFPLALLSQIISCPNVDVFNIYGTTEFSVWSSIYKIQNAQQCIEYGNVSIGSPFEGLKYSISESGELIIECDETRKCMLSIQYTGDLVKQDQETGNIYVLGRKKDSKVIKINGKRFHIEELQNQFEFNNPALKKCLLTFDSGANKLYGMFIVEGKDFSLAEDDYSSLLSGYTVGYNLPITFNNKIDFRALYSSLDMIKYRGNSSVIETPQFITDYRWRIDFQKCIDASPAMKDDYVYVGSHSGIFYKIHLNTGKTEWSIRLPDRIESSAAFMKCYVLVGCYDGRLYFIDSVQGVLVKYFQSQDIIKSDIEVQDGFICFGSYDNHIYILDENADLLYKTESKGSVNSKPLGINSGFVSASNKGQVLLISYDKDRLHFKHRELHYDERDPFFAEPVKWKNYVILTSVLGKVFLYDFENDCIRMVRELNEKVFSKPLILNSEMYTCTYHPSIMKINLETMTLQKDVKLSQSVGVLPSVPIQFIEKLIVISSNGNVTILDKNLNVKSSSIKIPGPTFGEGCVHKDCLIVGSRDNHLYCLNLI